MQQPGQTQRYTLEEYWKLIETFPDHKYEYADGHVRMMTGGSPAHAQLEARLCRLLDAALDDSECNVYGSDAIVRVAEQRYYCPDVSVSCDPADWTRTRELLAPTVIIEILSPATERIDKIEKLAAYQALPTIQEIIFVDSRRHHIEQYHRVLPHEPPRWEFTTYTQLEHVIDLQSIGVQLIVQDIYRKIYLEHEEKE